MQQTSQATPIQDLPIEQTPGLVPPPGLDSVSGPNSALVRVGEAAAQFHRADSPGPSASQFNDHMFSGLPDNFDFSLNSQLYDGSFTGDDPDILMSDMNPGSSWQFPATSNVHPVETSLARQTSPISSPQLLNDEYFGYQLEEAQLEHHVSPTNHVTCLSPTARLPAQNEIIRFPRYYTELLQELPFAKFEEYLSSQNIIFTNSESSTQKPLGASLSVSFALKCLEDGFSSGSQGMTRHPSQIQNYLQRLAKLLPGESTSIITEQQMTETRVIRILLYSMTNGFGGLQSVSIEDILKAMGHFGVQKMLLHLLQSAPPFVSRTLADNMFRGAIEAKDQRTVQLLLNNGLVDVNETVCFGSISLGDKTSKFTPVERAASLLAFGLVKILVEAGAQVNKTYEKNRFRHGALYNLLSAAAGLTSYSYPRKSIARPVPATPELISSLCFLIANGAKVTFGLLGDFLTSFITDDVICLISRSLPSPDHQTVFEPSSSAEGIQSCLLRKIVGALDDSTATTITQNIIDLCTKSGCSKCLETKQEVLQQATIQGAKRGHLKFVQLLFKHTPPTVRILSAAIRSGNEDLIRLVRHLDPNLELDPPAHCLCHESDRTHYNTSFADILLTSPLAEAIRAGNAVLVEQLEHAGGLGNLAEGNRLEALLLAAAEAGDVVYVESLLERAACSVYKYRPDWLPLRLALENDHPEVVKKLLLAGAQVKDQESGWRQELAFTAALRTRDLDLVRLLLSADISFPIASRIPRDVASWFDTSVLSDLIFVFPDLATEIPRHEFRERGEISTLQSICIQCMETDNVMFFKTFLESVSATAFPWNSCLASAISRHQVKMIELLLGYGASPFDDEVLKAATSDGKNMLPLILKEGQKERRVHQCIGAHILKYVMAERPGNSEVLDDLLESGMVNLTAAEEPNNYGPMLTPLGLAIVGLSGFCKTNLGAVRRLLRAGSDPNGIARIQHPFGHPRVGQTALMLALEIELEDLVRLLVEENKADTSKQTHLIIKQTPLQYAAKIGSLDMVRLLISLGAKVNEEPAIWSGGTTLQYAAMSGHCDMVAELLKKGAQLHALPSKVNGRWPLEGAAENGRLDMIELLWRANASLDGPGFQERHCLRAMDFAQSNGHLGCRDLIASLSDISVVRLESDDYGVPWLAY